MTKAKAGMDMTQNQPTLAQLDPTLAAPPPSAPPPAALPPAAPVDASVTEAANQPQQVPAASHGGLADIPLKMFKQRNFAPGGIVAFSDTGPETVGEKAKKEAETQRKAEEEQLKSDRESAFDIKDKIIAAGKDVLSAPMRAGAGLINLGIRGTRAITGANIPYIFGSDPNYTDSPTPYYDELLKKNTPPPVPSSATPRELQNADNLSNPKMNVAVPVTPIHPNPFTVAPSNTTTKTTTPTTVPTTVPTTPVKSIDDRMKEAREGIAALFPKSDIPVYKEYTPEEQIANFKAGLAMNEQKNALAGISKDPYGDYKARLERLDAEHAKARENEGFERFRAFASGMVHADPTKGLGAGMAGGADSVSALKLQQAALHDAHEKAALESMKAMAEAKEARARGDKTEADKYQSEKIAADKAKIDLALKLKDVNINLINASNHAVTATVAGFSAQNQADANKDLANFHKQSIELQKLANLKDPPNVAEYKYLIGNPAALKIFMDRYGVDTKAEGVLNNLRKQYGEGVTTGLINKAEYPNFDEYIKKLYPSSSSRQPSNSSLPPKVVKDGVTYILQSNGNYIKQ
jgi:hypothetical protein